VEGSCKYGDGPLGSDATEIVIGRSLEDFLNTQCIKQQLDLTIS
jgi:hypothetical protein